MIPATAFPSNYAMARETFLAAAKSRGLAIESHVNPVGLGAEGEKLAMDIAVLGAMDWPQALIVSSGTHGAEGFCGSGCQLSLLHDDILLRLAERERIALILVHAINPYGFSYLQRTNEDNVDLNRNFLGFDQPYPENPVYDRLHPLLVPDSWPPSEANEQALSQAQQALTAEERKSLSGGQASHRDGLFYAGQAPAWSNEMVRAMLRRHAATRQAVAWIDLHTGLGPYGHGEKIFAALDATVTARARQWWGMDLMASSSPDSVSPRIAGYITQSARQECPTAAITTMTLEYGTRPNDVVRQALRGDAWLRRHPDASPALRRSIKAALRDAFYIDADDWKGMIIGQFRATMLQTLYGMARQDR